jgi:Helix-hairpin-helix motif
MTLFTRAQIQVFALCLITLSVVFSIRLGNRNRFNPGPGIQESNVTSLFLDTNSVSPGKNEWPPVPLLEENAPNGTLHIMQFVPFPDRIDLNTADVDLLTVLPGIGPALANSIILDRSSHGYYLSVSDLHRIPGFTPHLIADLELYLTATRPIPSP